MKLLKKGQIGNLQGFILSIVTVAIILAVGLIILAELQTASETDTVHGVSGCNSVNKSGCGAAYNATGTIITKLADIPTWIGIIIIVSLAFIVISFFISKKQ